MSLNSMKASGEESVSSKATGGSQRVPLLCAASGHTGAHYAAWRPQMETFLMREGIESRDYKEEIPQWKDLETAVQFDTIAAEKAAIARLLSGGSSAVKIEPAVTDEYKAARKLVADLVGRSRKAYGFLFAALPEELRLLVADVPQGYAYGIWSFLEKRFQNTEQDNVADLWAQYIALTQEQDESFDKYKARVDKVQALLEHAKQQPPAGLRAHILLGRLQPLYEQAVLALKAGGQIKDADKVDCHCNLPAESRAQPAETQQ
jgi:hypothetical protein